MGRYYCAAKRLGHFYAVFFIGLMALLLILPAAAARADSTAAPEIPQHLDWVNSESSLSLAQFKGKYVLLDFWTYCCINCIHVVAKLKPLEKRYHESLVVIGVHSGKFPREKRSAGILDAVKRFGITHPVVNDPEYRVWHSYGVRAWPTLVLIDPSGSIVFKKSGENAVAAVEQLLRNAGVKVSAVEDTSNVFKRAASNQLRFPGKVRAEAGGSSLAVSDSGNNRILLVNDGGKVETIIGGGREGFADGSFEEALFRSPQGVVFDSDALLIADTGNHSIRLAHLPTKTVKTVLGTGTQGPVFNDGGKGTDLALNSPWDIAVVGSTLYIAMAGSHQIWKADMNSWQAEPYAGTVREGIRDGNIKEAWFAQPTGLAYQDGKLYIADSETSAVRFIDIAQAQVHTIVGKGLFIFGDETGYGRQAKLQHVQDIVVDGSTLYLVDTYNSKIKKINLENKLVSSLAGSGRAELADGAGKNASFNEPAGLTIVGTTLYVADSNNHALRAVDLASYAVRTIELRNN